METIIIDDKNFIAGMSSNRFTADGGYSPDSGGVNLIIEPGTLQPQPSKTSLHSTVLADRPVAMLENRLNNTVTDTETIVVGHLGHIYLLSGSTLTDKNPSPSVQYPWVVSDIEEIGGSVFITSSTDITRVTTASLGTIDEAWWVTTKGQTSLAGGTPHIITKVEGDGYISDGPRIHKINSSLGVTYAWMTLPYFITAMVKHPDGRHLIAFTSDGENSYGIKNTKSSAFIIDTVTAQFIAEKPLAYVVQGAREHEGVIYVGYGANLGYFNGDSISFLRKLGITISSASNQYLILKHHLASMGNQLLVAEGTKVLAFGNIGSNPTKVFWYCTNNDQADSNELWALYATAQDQLIYGTDSDASARRLYKVDFANAEGDTNKWWSNVYTFPKKAWIRRVDIETQALPSGCSFVAYYRTDPDGSATELAWISQSVLGSVTESRTDVNIYAERFQLGLRIAGAVVPKIRKVIIYWEPGDE